MSDPDLNKCPECQGPADNGHDRGLPPSPYYCSKCDPQMCQNFNANCTNMQPRLNTVQASVGSSITREFCDACFVEAKTPEWVMNKMRVTLEQLFDLQDSRLDHYATIDYIAANLGAALAKCKDTGDWYSIVVQWCEDHKGDCTPNED